LVVVVTSVVSGALDALLESTKEGLEPRVVRVPILLCLGKVHFGHFEKCVGVLGLLLDSFSLFDVHSLVHLCIRNHGVDDFISLLVLQVVVEEVLDTRGEVLSLLGENGSSLVDGLVNWTSDAVTTGAVIFKKHIASVVEVVSDHLGLHGTFTEILLSHHGITHWALVLFPSPAAFTGTVGEFEALVP
jgi:hypothetical protein